MRLSWAAILLTGAVWTGSTLFAENDGSQGLRRMETQNPDASADLAVGLWCWPVPVDVDKDGNTDLIVSCEDVPYNGVWYFRNSGDDLIRPTFENAKRLSRGVINVQASWIDGELRVLTPGNECSDFVKTGVDKPIPLKNGNENLPKTSILITRAEICENSSISTRTGNSILSSGRTIGAITAGTMRSTRTAFGKTGLFAAIFICCASRGERRAEIRKRDRAERRRR